MTQINAYWSTLMAYAAEVGRARASGDPERIQRAEEKHRAYEEICRQPNVRLIMDVPDGKG